MKNLEAELMDAVWEIDFKKFCYLISEGADVNFKDSSTGLSAVQAVCLGYKIPFIEKLLEHEDAVFLAPLDDGLYPCECLPAAPEIMMKVLERQISEAEAQGLNYATLLQKRSPEP